MYRTGRPSYAMGIEPPATTTPPTGNAKRHHQGALARNFIGCSKRQDIHDLITPHTRGPEGNGSNGGNGSPRRRSWSRQNQHDPPPSSTPAEPPISSRDMGLQPRPLPELVDERTLLLDELQRCDAEVRDLFAQLVTVHERRGGLLHDHASAERTAEYENESRRRRRGLMCRIELTVDSEREILVRIGELSVEIQCCERWWQVRRGYDPLSLGPMGPGPGGAYHVHRPPSHSSLPRSMPSPPGLPIYQPAPTFASPCECEQCTGIPWYQGGLPSFPSPRVYHSAGPVPSAPLNGVWRADNCIADYPPREEIPRDTSPKPSIPLEENTFRLFSRRKSLP